MTGKREAQNTTKYLKLADSGRSTMKRVTRRERQREEGRFTHDASRDKGQMGIRRVRMGKEKTKEY